MVGFVCKLHTSFSNTVYLKQLVQIGFLAQFESLLSTNGTGSCILLVALSFVYLICNTISDVSDGESSNKNRSSRNYCNLFAVFGLFSGDEMGMLEDACVSIANLTCIKFKVNMRPLFHLSI